MVGSQRIIVAFAALIGIVAVIMTMPLDAIMGQGPGWENSGPDQAQSLTGHLAFQADTWRWPLLFTKRLFWPHGVSLVLTDSNPAVSLAAKLWGSLTGRAPANWLGYWLVLCWIMQPVAAAYAARGLRLPPMACLAAAGLSVSWPALLFRYGHVNLCGHFLLLLALGLALRRPDNRRWWFGAGGVLIAGVLVHPYLFQLSGLILAAAPLQAALERRPGGRRIALGLLLMGLAGVGLVILLDGPMATGAKGFVVYSMNLLSPVWPQRSGVLRLAFGLDVPILNATGGQFEGFNWMGFGVALLALPAVAGWVRVPPAWRPARGLLIVLTGLTLLSFSSHVYAGNLLILDLGAKPWEDIFGSFRSAGRAFWPVGYALMLGAVAGVARWRWRYACLLFGAAVALQWVDAEPLRAEQRAAWTHGTAVPAIPVPPDTTLFGVAPYPLCQYDPPVWMAETQMLLDAVRMGARVRDVGVARPPPWLSCERLIADRVEEPLLPNEVRAFMGGARNLLNPSWLGPAATCHELPNAVLCGRGVAGLAGTPLSVSRPAPIGMPLALAGPDLAPVLGLGWRFGRDGAWWTTGNLGAVLLAVPPDVAGRRLVVTLHVAAVGAMAARVEAGTITTEMDLTDAVETHTLTVPAPSDGSGVRVVLIGEQVVDARRLGLDAPVSHTAIRLLGVEVRVE